MKTIFVMLFISCTIPSSQSQTTTQLSYGFFAGGNLSFITYDNTAQGITYEFKSKPGFQFGGFIDFYKKPDFSLSSGINFKRLGTNITQKFSGAANEGTIVADYFGFDINMKYRLEGEQVRPYLGGGLFMDNFLGFDLDVKSPPNQIFSKAMFEDKFRKLVFGGTVKAGIEFKISSINFAFVELSFSPNLTNNFEGFGLDLKNNSLSLSGGVNLR